MNRDLPPLAALRAFEATARRMSVRDAAEQLGVSASAVSHRLRKLERASELEARLAHIMSHATLVVFDNVSRGLFEAHKATFAFLVACAILRAAQQVSDDEWMTLLLGAGPTGAEKAPYGTPPTTRWLHPALCSHRSLRDR